MSSLVVLLYSESPLLPSPEADKATEKSFPVSRVGKKTASREVGIFFFFFFPNFMFYKLECTGGGGEKKTRAVDRKQLFI